MRLIDAAYRLMAERGMEGVSINEITEGADVGFGSFYNHFESKEAIYDAVLDAVFEEFADALDCLLGGVTDPAEVIAISVRHTILRTRREPIWGRFLIREGFDARVVNRGLGQRLWRDIQKGVCSRRFVLPDLLMGFVASGGIVLATVSAELEFGSADAAGSGFIKSLGLDSAGLPERAAAMVLQTLGVAAKEASAVAHRPLPNVGPAL